MKSENPQNRNLRDIFGKFATGVCAISFYGKDKKPRGITVNSFASVSLNPPLTLWCIDNSSDVYEEIIDKDKKIIHSELVQEIANEPNYEAALNSL